MVTKQTEAGSCIFDKDKITRKGKGRGVEALSPCSYNPLGLASDADLGPPEEAYWGSHFPANESQGHSRAEHNAQCGLRPRRGPSTGRAGLKSPPLKREPVRGPCECPPWQDTRVLNPSSETLEPALQPAGLSVLKGDSLCRHGLWSPTTETATASNLSVLLPSEAWLAPEMMCAHWPQSDFGAFHA